MRWMLLLSLAACVGPAPTDMSGEDGAGTGDTKGDGAGSGSGGTAALVELPPLGAKLDYQLGGAYSPPNGVSIISRDRTATAASGVYNICYVNGFQVQPGEESFWSSQHPSLVLRDGSGNPVVDANWDEWLLDVSTPAKQTAIADIVGDWIDSCADAGFSAIEIDNLDSYLRSGGRLTQNHAVAAMALFSERAHARGLAIAQKNSAELVARKTAMGTDFVVTEECNRYSECDDYRAAYGDHVLVIEYRQADLQTGCSKFPSLSIVLRDLNLVMPNQSGYVYSGC